MMNGYGPYDPNDPYGRKQGCNFFRHAGFRVGIIGGIIMVCVYLALFLFNEGDTRGDWLAWILQLLVYYVAGQAAAEQHHNAQLDELEHIRGVSGAAVGAALVTCAIVWIFIIIRGVARDAFGVFIIVEPVCLFFYIILDVLAAMGLGSLAGRSVVKKYDSRSNW